MSDRKFLLFSFTFNVIAIVHISFVEMVDAYHPLISVLHGALVMVTISFMLIIFMFSLKMVSLARREVIPTQSNKHILIVISGIFLNAALLYFMIIIFFNHLSTIVRYLLN